MKLMWSLLPPAVKAIAMVIFFFISVGWASYGAVLLIVRAEGVEIRKDAMEIRQIDIKHLDKRFDSIESNFDKRFDRVERLIQEGQK